MSSDADRGFVGEPYSECLCSGDWVYFMEQEMYLCVMYFQVQEIAHSSVLEYPVSKSWI